MGGERKQVRLAADCWRKGNAASSSAAIRENNHRLNGVVFISRNPRSALCALGGGFLHMTSPWLQKELLDASLKRVKKRSEVA
jgi:hypothetical protein